MDYFDLHCDTISEGYRQKVGLDKNHLQVSLEKGKDITNWIQVYAIWMDDTLQGEEAYQHFNEVYEYFMQQLAYQEDKMLLCTTPEILSEYKALEKRLAILGVEGSRALGGKLERVKEFYDKGVRIMTLTWNGRSEVGDGCMVKQGKGLTPFGEAVITQMQRLGMLVDVSHLSEQGFWQVEKMLSVPFIVSHSNSKAICNVPRNLTDEQFLAVVQKKGLVGINFFPMFINGTFRAHIKELLPHIDHFLELGGEKVIAIGSDFDGARMPKDMKNLRDIGKFYHLLVNRYGKERAELFFYKNAYSFFQSNLIR